MTLQQLRDAAATALAEAIAERKRHQDTLVALRAAVDTDDTITADRVDAAISERDAADAKVTAAQKRVADMDAELAREAELEQVSRQVIPTQARSPRYDEVARVGSEERTYAIHKERGFDGRTGTVRATFKPGADFERDVARAFLGDYEAQQRLARHQAEERVERGEYLSRAAGTGAFAGLVVPQYLTDLYAPKSAAMRPFADAINKHALPSDGMTVNISRITTSTSTAVQTENNAVSETNIDDTLLTISVQTIGGQQTLSRQAIERGTGVEAVTLDDLFRQYASTLDSTLITQATNGLTNVATAIAYTDASPTVAEFLPKVSQAAAAVESALLDRSTGDLLAVMHSRRWFWLNQALGTSFPLVAQPGVSGQASAAAYVETYGRGFRGVLPNAIPVVTDNNIATNLGAGTNEDEVYVVDRNECHLWEDPSAPMFIRAEQPAAASLGVLLVVYGYMAYSHARYSHAQKIGGTGLVTPTWTGV